MSKNFIKQQLLAWATILVITLTACTSDTQLTVNNAIKISIDKNISLEQVTQDVAYLASNELNGRGNFTQDINKAAQYIGKRFNEVGLIPAQNTVNFQQSYKITTTKPSSLSVIINGNKLTNNILTMASNIEDFSWNKTTEGLSIHIIDQADDMRKALTAINQQGGKQFVLLHPSHKKSFKHYQGYFSAGLTKLTNEEQNIEGTLIIALTDITKITHLSVEAKNELTETTISNVVGILPGKSKADEIVLYSAHYDHLGGIAQKHDNRQITFSDNNDGHRNIGKAIYNGADDDASGVSAIINLANHFKITNNHERTLMFAAFSAEEIGGFGSKHFATQVEAKSITAMINIEMIGKPAKFGEGTVWMTGMERSNLGEQLNFTLKHFGTEIYADPYPEQRLFYRSDNATLARLGVPAHSFSSTQLDKDKHYHQVTDDISSLNLKSMRAVIKTLAIGTTSLNNGSITPSRIDPNLVTKKGLIY